MAVRRGVLERLYATRGQERPWASGRGDARRLSGLETILTLLHDTPDVYPEWRRLVVQHDVKGVQVHDARLVVAMRVHGIDRILTYNPSDFRQYDGIAAIQPSDAQ